MNKLRNKIEKIIREGQDESVVMMSDEVGEKVNQILQLITESIPEEKQLTTKRGWEVENMKAQIHNQCISDIKKNLK